MTFEVPETHYCDPDMVAETLDLPDLTNPMDTYKFSNISHPTYDTVCRWIAANEDQIDQRLMRSWRTRYVKDQILDIPRYQHDENSWRSDYFLYGGYTIPLKRDVLPWDPEKGDKLEVRTYSGLWNDISNDLSENALGSQNFSFDYKGGRLMLRTHFRQPRYDAVRISYRYGGNEEDVPPAIQRLCSLMTAKQVLNSQFWTVKVGTGKDIAGVKNSMLDSWDHEINAIISSYQRPARVYSMITR